MKNNLIIGIVAVVVIIVGTLFYVNNENKPIPVNENPVVITEDPIVGCYVSKLAKDVYVLKINTETNGVVNGMLAFNNYEKDSSSGSFVGTYQDGILLVEYLFSSEGMDSAMQVIFKKEGNAFVRGYGAMQTEGHMTSFENLSAITYDSNQTFAKSADCKEVFAEENNKFTFEYDAFFKAYEPAQAQAVPNTEWKLNAKTKGMLLARVSIPKAFMPKTNFSNAYLTVGASTDSKEIKTCTTDKSNGEVSAGTMNISGFPFTKFTLGDAGAGNLYETTSYRGLLDGDCYVLEYTIHSTNIGVYSPEQGITQFDKAKVENEFESIIQSFRFLTNSS